LQLQRRQFGQLSLDNFQRRFFADIAVTATADDQAGNDYHTQYLSCLHFFSLTVESLYSPNGEPLNKC
jgi:hypothetical protein